jgi:hypothetical protein
VKFEGRLGRSESGKAKDLCRVRRTFDEVSEKLPRAHLKKHWNPQGSHLGPAPGLESRFDPVD